ncbi:MAG: ACT domain-containing protein [bacterium]
MALEPVGTARTSRNAAILTAVGLDGPGILARFTTRVATLNANVLDLQQTLIGKYFALTMIVDLSQSSLDFAAFRDLLTKEGEAVGVKVLIAHEDAFRAMHRV